MSADHDGCKHLLGRQKKFIIGVYAMSTSALLHAHISAKTHAKTHASTNEAQAQMHANPFVRQASREVSAESVKSRAAGGSARQGLIARALSKKNAIAPWS